MKILSFVPHYSRKMLLGASVLLLLFTGMQNAHAANEYGVDNVIVDATGKDATDARTKALAEGEKSAFAQLVLRLNLPNPSQALAKVTSQQVSSTVRGFTVVEEKMTTDHYHATLNYSFDPRQIQSLFPSAEQPIATPTTPIAATPAATTAAALPASPPQPATPAAAIAPATPAPTQPASPVAVQPAAPAAMPQPPTRKAVLVLPVYNDGNALMLWQDDNKWRSLWYDAALESGGGLVVVPLGDLDDRVDVDDTNVSTATPESLKRVYDRYAVGQVIVAQAFYNQKADPKPTLEVTVKKLLAGKAETTIMNYTIHSTETLDALMLRASSDIARSLYKQQTFDPSKVTSDRLKEISARVNTTNIKEWQALRQRLLMRSNIADIRFISISYYETNMIIVYRGTTDMLGKTLVAGGLRVLQDGDALVLELK